MATQTHLPIPGSIPGPIPGQGRFHLDAGSREAGRRGIVKARAALAEASERVAAARKADVDDHHATAA